MATDAPQDVVVDPAVVNGTLDSSAGEEAQPAIATERLDVLCGPLINYKYTSDPTSDRPVWHGSILIVTAPRQREPTLTLRCLGGVGDEQGPINTDGASHPREFRSQRLYEDPGKAFYRFQIEAPIQNFEARWEYSIPRLTLRDDKSNPSMVFVVPSRQQSMRIMFHSCNGFSVGTDLPAFSGPGAMLWKDVIRNHERKPFHVMIGGGDQIYQDSVRVDGPLRAWSGMKNPHKRREYPFNEELRAQCDEYYYQNYVRWYGMDPFRHANAQIPQINIWDDHDIIDGFGSYTDHFMRCHVFRGIGGVAHKYYMLFQHHVAPPKSTFTTDNPNTAVTDGPGDTVQTKDTFVLEDDSLEPCYIIGHKPGPYVEQHSRNMYAQLGARIAFAGIDARMERTRHQINYPETYKLLFDRITKELSANNEIKHLILLLGVPIAYPRLQWLENIISSPIIGPIRFLNRRFGFAGGVFNTFDGQVDLLDDLDDHYTARNHKAERRELVHSLQNIAKNHGVRITILGGDVHLAAVGRFFSNAKLAIPVERDFRYMVNVVSSAICNKPPPNAVANLLARRNKVHHLDHDTDETLLELFHHAPGASATELDEAPQAGCGPCGGNRRGNVTTMPSRNYAIVAESGLPIGAGTPTPLPADTPATKNKTGVPEANANKAGLVVNPRLPLHSGEVDAGANHPAASGLTPTGMCGPFGLDVTLRVEIDSKNAEGVTDGYGFSIPGLSSAGPLSEK